MWSPAPSYRPRLCPVGEWLSQPVIGPYAPTVTDDRRGWAMHVKASLPHTRCGEFLGTRWGLHACRDRVSQVLGLEAEELACRPGKVPR